MRKSIWLALMAGMVLVLAGCNDSSAEAKKYETLKAYDEGDADKVISMLGECTPPKYGFTQDECDRTLGAAYLSRAGMNLTAFGKELLDIDDDDADADTQRMILVSNKVSSADASTGIDYFKRILDRSTGVRSFWDGSDETNSTRANRYARLCTPKGFRDVLTTTAEKEACRIVNPLLLADLLSDDDGTETRTSAVDLQLLTQTFNTFRDVAPEVDMGTLVKMATKKDDSSDSEQSKDDINANGKLDGVEATECVVGEVNATNLASGSWTVLNCDDGVSVAESRDLNWSYNPTMYAVLVKVDSNDTQEFEHRQMIRLVQELDETGRVTTVNQKRDARGNLLFCNEDRQIVSGESTPYGLAGSWDDEIYPCPAFEPDAPEEEQLSATLAGTVTNIFNDDDTLGSFAAMEEGDGGDDRTPDDVRKEVCEGSSCSTDVDGNTVVTQDALIKHLSK